MDSQEKQLVARLCLEVDSLATTLGNVYRGVEYNGSYLITQQILSAQEVNKEVMRAIGLEITVPQEH